MKANWKQRYEQQNDSRVGAQLDTYIDLGIKFAYCAIHEELGIGRKKLDRVSKNILDRIEKDFKAGAPKFSEEMRINIEIGTEKLDREYKQIMTYGDKAAEKKKRRKPNGKEMPL